MDDTEDRLYGEPGDEYLESDPSAVHEREHWLNAEDDTWTRREAKGLSGYMEPVPPPGFSYVIEEWSVEAPGGRLPDGGRIAERVVELYCEDTSEEMYEAWLGAAQEVEVAAAFQAARDLLASKVSGWKMADKLLRTLTVTFDDDGEPLLDGEPMYVKRAEVDQ